MFAFQAGWVEVELCWEVAVSFFFITDRTLSAHRCQKKKGCLLESKWKIKYDCCQVDTLGFLPFCVQLCGVVYIQGLVHGSESLNLGV